MSNTQENFPCPHHGVMENRVENLEKMIDRIEKLQSDQHEKENEFMKTLDQKISLFMDDTDAEIMGSKGPDGKPGIKPIVYMNRKEIAFLKERGDTWKKLILANILAPVAATVIAAIILAFIFLRVVGQS